MLRYVLLASAFGALFLVACGDGITHVTETLEPQIAAYPCQPVGQAVQLDLPTHVVSRTCTCQDHSQQGLGSYFGIGPQECLDEYDVGGPNPQVCSSADDGPKRLKDVSVHLLDLDGCTATATEDDDVAGLVHVTVQCSSAGHAELAIDVGDDIASAAVPLDFGVNAYCPLR